MEKQKGCVLHLGMVVEDLEKAVSLYESKLGIGPWEVDDAREFFADKLVNDGKGLNIKTATYRNNGYELELVMPVGPGIYEDWLRDRGPGLHHVKLETGLAYEEIRALGDELEGEKSHYLDIRWPEDQSMLVSYTDLTRTMGLMLEAQPEADE